MDRTSQRRSPQALSALRSPDYVARIQRRGCRTGKLKPGGTRFLVGAYREWSRAGLPPVTVHVRAVPSVAPEKGAVPALARQLVSFVAARVPPVGGAASFERDWRTWALSPILPEGVAAIDILRPSYHDEAYWFMPRAGMVPDLSATLVQNRVSLKNERFRRYAAPPASNWLLLVVEGTAPSSTFTFVPEALEHTYESVFSKTFLFDAFSRRAFALRTSHPSGPAA